MSARTLQTRTRRAEILDAALACFSEVGIEATTVEMLCERSGASVGSLYHHFGDKAGIAAALAADGIARYQEGLLAILAAPGTPHDGVAAMVHHHLSWIERHPDWSRFLFTEYRVTPDRAADEVQTANRRLLSALTEWIDRHASAGLLTSLPSGIFLAVALGPSQELSRRWLTDRASFDLHGLHDVLAAAAQRAVGADRHDAH